MAKHRYAVALAAAAFSVYSPAFSAESGVAAGRPDAPAQTPGDRPVIFNPSDVWLKPCPGRMPLGDGEPLDLCFEHRLRESHHPRPLAETLKTSTKMARPSS